jgi:hypothetical protein
VPVEKIAGDQWLQSLEKRIERVVNLAPGSLQAAAASTRPPVRTPVDDTEIDAAASAEKPSRPAQSARPSSAIRARRPQSANVIARRSHLAQQQQEQKALRVVGAGQPGQAMPRVGQEARASSEHRRVSIRLIRAPGAPAVQPQGRRRASYASEGDDSVPVDPEPVPADEEWNQLGVPEDTGSDCSEEDLATRMAWLLPVSPLHSGPQKHQVSPCCSPSDSRSPSKVSVIS